MDEYGRYILTFGFELMFILCAYSLIKNVLALKMNNVKMLVDRPTAVFIWVMGIAGFPLQIPFLISLKLTEFTFPMASGFAMVVAWIFACDCIFARKGERVILGFREYEPKELKVVSVVKKTYYTNVALRHKDAEKLLVLKTNERLWQVIEPVIAVKDGEE